MPLIIAPLNVVLTIVKILLDDKTKKHLESLGITIDSKITLLDNVGGNVVIMVKDGRLALDKNIATKNFSSLGREDKTMLKRLSDFTIGETGLIKMVKGEGRIRRRLFDMGVTPGAEVVLVKKAPLGDPLEVKIRGYDLTLRKDEAIFVELEVNSKESK